MYSPKKNWRIKMEKIRKAAVAGQFYPGTKEELEKELNLLFQIAKPEKQFDNIAGIVAPHAGYIYSGKTAAKVYSLLKGKKYKSVIVISPSHYEYFFGSSIFDGDYYETPLGRIPIDKELAKSIAEHGDKIRLGEEGHKHEHALEVHLPFIQKELGEFTLVPVVMGDQSKRSVDDLANALAKTTTDEHLIVASSDMSHFYPKDIANKLDSMVEKRISEYNYDALMEELEKEEAQACGGGPIVAMMKALHLRGKRNSVIIDRSDSGDVSGDNERVVGYLSAVVY